MLQQKLEAFKEDRYKKAVKKADEDLQMEHENTNEVNSHYTTQKDLESFDRIEKIKIAHEAKMVQGNSGVKGFADLDNFPHQLIASSMCMQWVVMLLRQKRGIACM
jgi:hypothetical protein